MEYSVKVNKIESQNVIYDSSAECLEVVLEEYRHVVERANKYDNKVNIMITFCGIYFALIITLLDRLVDISFPKTTNEMIL